MALLGVSILSMTLHLFFSSSIFMRASVYWLRDSAIRLGQGSNCWWRFGSVWNSVSLAPRARQFELTGRYLRASFGILLCWTPGHGSVTDWVMRFVTAAKVFYSLCWWWWLKYEILDIVITASLGGIRLVQFEVSKDIGCIRKSCMGVDV